MNTATTTPPKEFAFLESEDGGIVFGFGPFNEKPTPPKNESSFYVNQFSLDDPNPWKIPTKVIKIQSLSEVLPCTPNVEIKWNPVIQNDFHEIFSSIKTEIHEDRVIKLVPVVTETGDLLTGTPNDLITPRPSKHGLWNYGYCVSGKGFTGATPERFITKKEQSVSTMALAGTTKTGLENGFKTDTKEIREHELVAGFILDRLDRFGKTSKESRDLLELEDLTHFITSLSLELENEISINHLLAALHPTPAVGHLPHDATLLSYLQIIRAQLGCPSYFGSPFGFLQNGNFHSVVTIRGIFWDNKKVSLPAGCGIIEESEFEKEWEELELKRNSVKKFLGV